MWSHDFPHDLKFETGFSVEIRANLPVPILAENEHCLANLAITDCVACFFGVKTQPFTHCFYFEY